MRYSSVVLFVAPLFLSCEASRPFPKLGRDEASSGIFATYATGTGTAGYAPTSTSKPMPPDSPSLACHGTDNEYWTPPNDATQAIKDFCGQSDLNTHDPKSGSRQRFFNKDTLTEMSIAIDWPQGSDIDLNQDDCVKHMTMILDNCDGNNPQNPLNWKHGGNLTVGPVVYHVDPIARRYFAGQCYVNVAETHYPADTSFPESFVITVIAFTGEKWKNTAFAQDDEGHVDFTIKYTLPHAYYAPLSITPAFVGTNFAKQDKNVEFRIGDQVWSKNDTQRFVLTGQQPADSNTTTFTLNFDC